MAAWFRSISDQVQTTHAAELAVTRAKILPPSAVVDLTGRWLTFAARATHRVQRSERRHSVCVLELRSGGTLRDVTALGPAEGFRVPLVPLTWAPTPTSATTYRLAYMAPRPQHLIDASS